MKRNLQVKTLKSETDENEKHLKKKIKLESKNKSKLSESKNQQYKSILQEPKLSIAMKRNLQTLKSETDENEKHLKKKIKLESKNKSKLSESKNQQYKSILQEPKLSRFNQTERISDISKITKHGTLDIDIEPVWTLYELLSEHNNNLNLNVSKHLVNLFNEGNTVPFIARYRRNLIGDLTPESIRDIKHSFNGICNLEKKIKSVIKQLDRTILPNEELIEKILNSRTPEELEFVYAPFKPEQKMTLASKAKQAGLEKPAEDILSNKAVSFHKYLTKDINSIEEVIQGIIYIISATIAKDTDVLSYIRQMKPKYTYPITCSKSSSKLKNNDENALKFKNYFDFTSNSNHIKPHQILAINRAETLKVLSIKITIPNALRKEFNQFASKKWQNFKTSQKSVSEHMSSTSSNQDLITKAIEDSYIRSIQPLLVREIRADLKAKAQKVSCQIFSNNLKELLLTSPLKGCPILGIDPGFKNGCKIALVSPIGTLVTHAIIYPFKDPNTASKTIRDILLKNNCQIIALGNRTASRETEQFLTKAINNCDFQPLDVKYTIVNEDGASVYSCSQEAHAEFPNLDPNIISAASLARRVQDPMSELVKVEPRHLGVGMYQHDLKNKHLNEALNDVVSECVSFVGVDLNTSSKCLLKHISGLSEKRAEQVIEYREKNRFFTHRNQLLEVSGIGKKVFEQCAGFLRISPINESEQSFYADKIHTKFDQTEIHPESYSIARRILKKIKLKEIDIGRVEFIKAIKNQTFNFTNLQQELNTDVDRIKFIIEALKKPLNYDLRAGKNQNMLFKKEISSTNDIKVDSIITGRVCNVTNFGCFVDIGVETNGLIHTSKYNGFSFLLGDTVTVKVLNIELKRKRIQLHAVSKP